MFENLNVYFFDKNKYVYFFDKNKYDFIIAEQREYIVNKLFFINCFGKNITKAQLFIVVTSVF